MTTESFTSLEPLSFVPVRSSECHYWRHLKNFECLDSISVLPLADTEILAMSHFCPLAIEFHAVGPRVVACVHSSLVTHSLLSPEARWRPPYAPLALRSLPFRNGPDLAPDSVEMCLALALKGGEQAALPIYGPGGRISQPFSAILTMLDRIARSTARIRNAGKVLLAADLLEPLAPIPSSSEAVGSLFTVSPDSLLKLHQGPLLGLTADHCLPLELAVACVFSRRWLPPDALLAVSDRSAPIFKGVREKFHEHHFIEPLDTPLMFDDSPLFSMDEDLRADPAPGESARSE